MYKYDPVGMYAAMREYEIIKIGPLILVVSIKMKRWEMNG